MNEYLLKAIVRLFAIVSKDRVTGEASSKLKRFLLNQINEDELNDYFDIFKIFSHSEESTEHINTEDQFMAPSTQNFVEDWANVILICKHINTELTEFQKVILILRLLELVISKETLTEQQENYIYYIGKTINVSQDIIKLIRKFVIAEKTNEFNDKNMLIVDNETTDTGENYKHILRPNLTGGFIGVLYLHNVELYFIKYIGNHNVRLNGLTMRSRAIFIFPAGSNVRGDKLKSVYYSDVVNKFKSTGKTTNLTLTAQNLRLRFKQGKIGLRNINISENSGSLVGIMGASGSGKSTLIEVLNGKIKPNEGLVTINNFDLHKEPEKLEGIIGYVPQDDLLLEDLTVFENLLFAAKLCLANKTYEEIIEIVNHTLLTLGIFDIKALKVGTPLKRTISGGQRKRLNIGLELLREPSILFLDEPTSGLSSRDSENIMDLLKELSLRGKLVITALHQPSSDIFKLFDSLIILDVGGYQIYYGNPVDAITYFRGIARLVQRDHGFCMLCGNVKVEQVFTIIEMRIVNEYGRLTSRRKIQPKEWAEHYRKRFKPKNLKALSELPRTSLNIPSRIKQLEVFIKRDVLSKISNKQYLLVNFLETPLLALIIGYFLRYYNILDTDKVSYIFNNNPNIPSYFFMSIIVALFIGLSISGEEIIKDRKILDREKFLNLSRGTYLASKVIILFVISAIQMLTYVAIADSLLQFSGMTTAWWLILFLTASFANAIGLNISSAFNSVITIYILVPLILIPQLMFNGVAISFEKLNPKISDVKNVPFMGELMVSKWAYEGIMVNQFKKNKFERDLFPLDKEMANAQYKYQYYIPTLQTKLEISLNALSQKLSRETIRDPLLLLKHEIGKELAIVGDDNLPAFDKLDPQKFDSATYYSTTAFLKTLKHFYNSRYNKYEKNKDKLLSKYRHEKDGNKRFIEMMNKYKNENITEIVKNIMSPVRILEYDNKLIRKIYPIYEDPEIPDNPLNFRTHYYAPRKYFAGAYIDTYWFNLFIIMSMTLIALIALYYDVLRRFIAWIGHISEMLLVWSKKTE